MNKNTNLFLAVAIWLGCMLALYTFFPGVVGAKKQPSHQAPAEAPAPTPAPAQQPAPDGMAAAPRPADVESEGRLWVTRMPAGRALKIDSSIRLTRSGVLL